MLTPIAKSWPSQWCLEANSLAIQVLGGYGYTREYPVEQLYRDNRLNPIHEGTHGIQGLDLLGRKVVMQGGAGLQLLRRRRSGDDRPRDGAGGELGRAGRAAAGGRRPGRRHHGALFTAGDVEVALANASVYLEAVGHVVLAWIWLEQLLAADGRDGDFYDGKRQAGALLLPLGAAEDRPSAGAAGVPRHDDAGRAARLVLSRRRRVPPAAAAAASTKSAAASKKA